MPISEKLRGTLCTIVKAVIGFGIGVAAAFVYVFILMKGKGKDDASKDIKDKTDEAISRTREEIAAESSDALARRANEWLKNWGKK